MAQTDTYAVTLGDPFALVTEWGVCITGVQSIYSQDSEIYESPLGDYVTQSELQANKMQNVVVEYQIKGPFGAKTVYLGRPEFYNGYTVTQLEVLTTNTDWPKIRLYGHRHDQAIEGDTPAHTHYNVYYSAGIPALTFGAKDFIGMDTAETITIGSTYRAMMQHFDEKAFDLTHITGVSLLPRIDGEQDLLCTLKEYLLAENYDHPFVFTSDISSVKFDSMEINQKNDDFLTAKIRYHRNYTL